MTEATIPHNFKPLYGESDIAAAVSRLGGELTAWADAVWKDSHTDLLAIPVLRGGIFFFADLVRAIPRSVEIAPAFCWAYDAKSNSPAGEVGVDIERVPARGRSVLLVDDICDSGRTLAALKERLIARGAHEVRSAVLVRRAVPDQVFSPDWTAFEYPGTEWLVGYGMDDSDRWRNLPAIYIIRQE